MLLKSVWENLSKKIRKSGTISNDCLHSMVVQQIVAMSANSGHVVVLLSVSKKNANSSLNLEFYALQEKVFFAARILSFPFPTIL